MSRRRHIAVGDMIGDRFRLVAEIGEGGMGRVYEALDTRFERRVAVKIIARRLAQDEQFRARFIREAEAAERATHPHILPVFDYGSVGDYLYLAVQWCDTDLAAYIDDQEGPLTLDETLRLAGPIAWALDWAHGRGVVHRDVKPENILLFIGPSDIHPYLADFGMARVAVAATLTQAGGSPGLSPAYAAPEQWESQPVSAATDQYALAATVHTCLTGRPPFNCRTVEAMRDAHLNRTPPTLHDLGAYDADAVSSVLRVALAKQPDVRYSSCQQFIAALRDAARTAGVPGRTTARESHANLGRPTEPERPSGSAPDAPSIAFGDRPTAVSAAQPPSPAAEQATGAAEHATVVEGQTEHEVSASDGLWSRAAQSARRRSVVVALAAVAALAIAAVGVVLLAAGGGNSAAQAQSTSVSGVPGDAATVADHVWVASQANHTVSDLAGSTKRVIDVAAIAGDGQISQIAAYQQRVCVASADGRVQCLDAGSGRPAGPVVDLGKDIYDMALDDHALWVADGEGNVIQVPVAGQVLGLPRSPIPLGSAVASLAVGAGRVWAITVDGTVASLDPASGRVAARGSIYSPGPPVIAAADGHVWAADPNAGTLLAIDARTAEPGRTVKVARGRAAVLAGGHGVIAYVSADTGAAAVVDAATGQATKVAGAAPSPAAAAIADDRLWLTYPEENLVRSLPLPDRSSWS